MPIRLTWTPPEDEGSGIVLYKLFKTINPGPLTQSHLFATADGGDTAYDDYVYSRRHLMEDGYLYKITAVTDDAESPFADSNLVLVTYSFEDFLATEDWDFGFIGEESLELFENWDVDIPFTPNLLYDEEWEFSVSPSLAYDEEWNFPFTPDLLYEEEWEATYAPTITEPWDYDAITYDETLLWTEIWSPAYTGSGGAVLGGVGTTELISAEVPADCSVDNQGGAFLYINFIGGD